MTLGERLREAMKVRSYTQIALAGKLGIRQPLISQWVTGKRFPDGGTLMKLCVALSISVDWLLLGIGPMAGPLGEPEQEVVLAAQERRLKALAELAVPRGGVLVRELRRGKTPEGYALTVFSSGKVVGEQAKVGGKAKLVKLVKGGAFALQEGDLIVVDPGNPLHRIASENCNVLLSVGGEPPKVMHLLVGYNLALLSAPGSGSDSRVVNRWTLASDDTLVLGKVLYGLREIQGA